VAHLIQSKLTWILENGKMIRVWDDVIIENLPIGLDEDFLGLMEWMENQGIKSLSNISLWDEVDS
jgi:hypothetical protein